MNQQNNPLQPLSISRPKIVGEHAFEGDLLSRKKLAERLTGYLDRLKEGAVLAIDAQWGDGKTWFGRNWAKYLESEGHKVVFIDAFEQDYIEDPFLLIAAEIAETLDDGNEGIQELREKATGVMKAILPVGTKALINITGRILLGSGDLSDEIKDAVEAANDTTADVASQWIEKKLLDHAQEKVSLQHFRNELESVAKAQDKPVVVFIDELDRCRPSFAVQLIERVKHFFDVPNVVFVLLINREQLEKAIKGVYGAETDATAYLGKFVNFFFFLPKQHSDTRITRRYIQGFVSHALERYQFDVSGDHLSFRDIFSLIANSINLSLREIERGIALYAFAQPLKVPSGFLAYLIAIKIGKPKLFQRLIDGEHEAHKELLVLIEPFQETSKFFKILTELHVANINGFNEIGENLSATMQNISWHYDISVDQLLPFLAEQIDLPMEL